MGKLDKGRCGLCCSLVVKIFEEDIKRIENLGHKRDFFVENIENNKKALKRINGYCRFLVIKEGIATCTIYDHRPKVCREYVCIPPGMNDCKLKRHYDIVDITKI
ncbi:hypothetical protein A3K72_01320 [Candidatus Woesearchaeota archaeon RBG_13_36_6]|nr:MAG: hypothetical protein A3K72_01320 [Candidatus Woesearchaeota archaeon RBG_13_36_6]